jgi:hypothetical protein
VITLNQIEQSITHFEFSENNNNNNNDLCYNDLDYNDLDYNNCATTQLLLYGTALLIFQR